MAILPACLVGCGWEPVSRVHIHALGAVCNKFGQQLNGKRMRSSIKLVESPAGLPKVYAEVQFGSPKDGCRGSGICRVFTTIGARRLRESPRRAAVMMGVQPSGFLVFWIRRKALSAELLQEVFQGSSFIMQEEFVLGGSMAAALGKESIVVPRGAYPIRGVRDWLMVEFDPTEGGGSE